MNYIPAVVPQLPQVCYTLLASPSVDVYYTCSRWDQSRQEQVSQVLLGLMRQELTPQEATNLICT